VTYRYLFRSKLAIALSGIYLLLVAAAFIYAAASAQKFAGLVAVFLALPWFDYLPIDPPAALFFGCFLLNASLLFVLGLLLSCAAAGLRRR